MTTQPTLQMTPRRAGHRDTQVTAEGRIYDRWEPTPEGVERGTWGRAWIGVVAVSIRSADAEATAGHLRSRAGENEAQGAAIAYLMNAGTIQGDRAKIERDLWICDPTVTVEDGRAVYRQEVEIQQDFGPEPTREEEDAGWLRLTGLKRKHVADIVAELDAEPRAHDGVVFYPPVNLPVTPVAVHDLGGGETGVVVVGRPAAQAQAPKTRGGREGWTRMSAPGNKCGARWRHDTSGWLVRHCGHPTANWPYYATDPDDPEERVVVTHNGKGWRRLAEAMETVEGVLSGRLVATNERCGPRTRRVLSPAELATERERIAEKPENTGESGT